MPSSSNIIFNLFLDQPNERTNENISDQQRSIVIVCYYCHHRRLNNVVFVVVDDDHHYYPLNTMNNNNNNKQPEFESMKSTYERKIDIVFFFWVCLPFTYLLIIIIIIIMKPQNVLS